MLIYLAWETFIKDGSNELYEYFAFVFFSIILLPADILVLPVSIIAFILYKLRGRE